jgi:phosphoenolpyruvate carboxylase
MTILLRVVIALFFIAFLTSSISTAEEDLNQKVDKPSDQERVSMSSSLVGADKDGNPSLQETNGIPPKEPPQPPSPQ